MLFMERIAGKFVVCICSLALFAAACVTVNLRAECFAEEGNVVLSKSVRIMKGGDTIETIDAKDATGKALANAKITITIEDPSKVSITAKDATADDHATEGHGYESKTGANGKKAFVIKGLRGGSSAIHFDILPEGGSEADVVKEVVTVNVRELVIKQEGSW